MVPDVNVLGPFVDATLDVLETMARVSASVARTETEHCKRVAGDVSGIMGYSGGALGAIAVTFNSETARQIVARMVGVKPEALTEAEMEDGVGELVNMISGNAKAALAKGPYRFKLSLPSVVRGPGHEIVPGSHAPCAKATFSTEWGEFVLQVCFAAGGEE